MNNRSINFLAGVGIGSALLFAYKPSRDRLKEIGSKLSKTVMNSKPTKQKSFPVEKAGNPHPQDFEDNKMVSEGAMYSVDYYNQKEQA
ncbi:hypothetical protein LS684_03095 [Cytobacillus spongiae]|jgi:hypothetical protein|uniref:hypothetical protein n=1 Tax=Cytobacillus spongiae TaxID=2901381 RepID=UPI001F47D0DB|nr:hypothetical protein [Cytobacillus spongiae]UII56486.1 hypothetical protein LS684_03095 [Cytobacillus spongiae]